MPLYKLTDQQLNYFKFAAVAIDEFPVALRETFKSMWDNRYAGPPTSMHWDDSPAVRSQLKAQEGGAKEIPTHLSYDEWDCTALFKATIYAHSFKESDPLGRLKTLDEKYIKPLKLPRNTFHTTVTSSTGNQSETTALAIDQLRRLRNAACHQSSTRNIDKATFDQYMELAGKAFDALGLSRETIDNIRGMKEEDFPTEKVLRLLERLLVEDTGELVEKVDELRQMLVELREQFSPGKRTGHMTAIAEGRVRITCRHLRCEVDRINIDRRKK